MFYTLRDDVATVRYLDEVRGHRNFLLDGSDNSVTNPRSCIRRRQWQCDPADQRGEGEEGLAELRRGKRRLELENEILKRRPLWQWPEGV